LNECIVENLTKESKTGEMRHTTKTEKLKRLGTEVIEILKQSISPMALAYLQHELSKRIKQKIDVKKYGYEKFSTFVGKHIHKS